MMLLQIYFEVPDTNQEVFEQLYANIYVPALMAQTGYLSSNLLQIFPQTIAEEIDAAPTSYNYIIELVFDSESNRRLWVASKEHAVAWPQAEALATRVKHRAYNVISHHVNTDTGD